MFHVPPDENVADALTKALPGPLFRKFRDRLLYGPRIHHAYSNNNDKCLSTETVYAFETVQL